MYISQISWEHSGLQLVRGVKSVSSRQHSYISALLVSLLSLHDESVLCEVTRTNRKEKQKEIKDFKRRRKRRRGRGKGGG